MLSLNASTLHAYREVTYRTRPEMRLHSKDDAVAFVAERGFAYFWPITGIAMPSLWAAAAGDRPVADAHDDPGHVTWGWKDELLGQRRWHYAKVLRKKATMISLQALPSFYALSENYGSPDEDYLTLYEQGRLTQEARLIYETILENGPMHTVELRKKARMASRESDGRFNRALTDLQTDFKILPVGVAKAGGWNYAFIYEIVARHYPDLIHQTMQIKERTARRNLAEHYLRSVGAAQLPDLTKLFGWTPRQAQRALDDLTEEGLLCCGVQVENGKGESWALRELLGTA